MPAKPYLKCHIYTFSEPLQGWGLHRLPGQPVPMSDHSFSKEIFPNIQSKPPLTHLQAISSHPIASYLEELEFTLLNQQTHRLPSLRLASEPLGCFIRNNFLKFCETRLLLSDTKKYATHLAAMKTFLLLRLRQILQ